MGVERIEDGSRLEGGSTFGVQKCLRFGDSSKFDVKNLLEVETGSRSWNVELSNIEPPMSFLGVNLNRSLHRPFYHTRRSVEAFPEG